MLTISDSKEGDWNETVPYQHGSIQLLGLQQLLLEALDLPCLSLQDLSIYFHEFKRGSVFLWDKTLLKQLQEGNCSASLVRFNPGDLVKSDASFEYFQLLQKVHQNREKNKGWLNVKSKYCVSPLCHSNRSLLNHLNSC